MSQAVETYEDEDYQQRLKDAEWAKLPIGGITFGPVHRDTHESGFCLMSWEPERGEIKREKMATRYHFDCPESLAVYIKSLQEYLINWMKYRKDRAER